MEPCLEKEMVHHYECVDGRGWGSLNVGRNWWWVGLLGVYMHVCVCVRVWRGDSITVMGKLDFFFHAVKRRRMEGSYGVQ